nr:hypothetical protein [Sinorhizobium fredii]
MRETRNHVVGLEHEQPEHIAAAVEREARTDSHCSFAIIDHGATGMSSDQRTMLSIALTAVIAIFAATMIGLFLA